MNSQRHIQSKIFGVVTVASPSEREMIESLVTTFPVDVFQALNISLNKRGLRLGIGSLRSNGGQREERMDPTDIMSDPRIRDSGPVE